MRGINDIQQENVEIPEPGRGEALVAVKAAGICGSDIPRIYGAGAHVYPLIPGHEASGIVEAVGDGVEREWLGQRIGIFPLIPCGRCGPCRRKQYEMCRNYGYAGSRQNGAFADYMVMPVWNLIKLPDEISYEEAAMLEPMAVAVHALRRGTGEFGLDKGAAVAVCGLGAIGLLLVMFLLEAGYRNVYAVGNKEAQKKRALSIGILPDHYCDSRISDAAAWLQAYAGGAELFFECAGRNDAAMMGVDSAGPAGKVVFVGNPCSDMTFEKDSYWRILRNQLTVMGTWNSSFTKEGTDDWNYAIKRLETRRVAPARLISHRFISEQLREGLAVMRSKKEDYCKIMITGNLAL